MNLFEVIILTHLIGDWILQPTKMAVTKSTIMNVRSTHCMIYTICFGWLGAYFHTQPVYVVMFITAYVYLTHHIIDSYYPLYYFRKLRGDLETIDEFKESFKTPSGFMINVVLDQIFHIITLLPILYIPTK